MQTDTLPKTQIDWIDWSKEIVEPDPVIIDFETRSILSPRDHGSWKYSLDQSTEALCLSYQLYPGGKILRWNKEHTDPITGEIVIAESDLPFELFEAIKSGRLIEAHNVFFERAIWTNVMVARHGWPELVEENLRCSAARAASASMPRALDKLGEAIPGIKEKKDKEGNRLMKQLMKPRKHTKDTAAAFTEAFGKDKKDWPILWWEDPTKHRRNWEYCDQDIRAERAVSDWLPHLSEFELKVWQLDQRMNLRGVSCDTDLANQAIEIAAKMNGVYKEKCRELTGFSPGQRPKIRKWLANNCTVDVPDTGRETLEREIKKCDDYVRLAKQGKLLPDDAERVLDRYPEAIHAMNLIIKGNRTSVRKFNTMLKRCTPSDSRIRDIMLYCGAYRTGRWSGVGIQPHNYPRGSVKYIEYPHQMNEVCDHILSVDTEDLEEIEWLELEYGLEPVELMSGIARGALRAANDHVLFAADFAAIEARAVFWLAGCESGLKMFRESDAGTGPEVYCAMASLIYGYAVNKKDHKAERQFGKQAILGLGFGMGFITFLLTCKKYKISFTKAQVKKIVDPESYAKLEKKIRIKLGGGRKLNRDTNKWERIKPDYNALDQLFQKDIEWKVVLHELILMQYTVNLYRSKFPEVRQFWNDCNDTAIAAMEDGVNRLHVNDKIWYQYDWAKEALLCGLPSGRKIYYQGAYLKPKPAPWGEVKQCIRYYEELGTARHWTRTHTYGGKLCENIVQATARDLMAYSMLVADQNGTYRILMSVHDELVCEARAGEGNVSDFEAIMTTLPPWAANDNDPFPIAAEAWEGQRYMKA